LGKPHQGRWKFNFHMEIATESR